MKYMPKEDGRCQACSPSLWCSWLIERELGEDEEEDLSFARDRPNTGGVLYSNHNRCGPLDSYTA